MNTMANPRSFRTGRTPRLALATTAALLLGPAPRPAEAICPESPRINLPPLLATDNPSVVVNEGQTAENSGTFEETGEDGSSDRDLRGARSPRPAHPTA
jgi:hypothetical protein